MFFSSHQRLAKLSQPGIVSDMKLIQMNVWFWRLYWPMRRFLERERPDFILAQEAIDGPCYQMADYYTSRGIVEEKLLRHYLQTPGRLYAIKKNHELQQGLAIFGQSPLTQVAVITIDKPDSPRYDPYYQMIHATTEVNGKILNLITYHGHLGVDISGAGVTRYGTDLTVPGEPRLGSAKTEADFAKIAAYIDTVEGPVIFTGDFNLWATARSFDPLKPRLENLIERYGITSARNEMAWKTDEAVSHVFVSREIKVNSFKVATDLVSDHQPLILDFDL